MPSGLDINIKLNAGKSPLCLLALDEVHSILTEPKVMLGTYYQIERKGKGEDIALLGACHIKKCSHFGECGSLALIGQL